ncbi:MAG: rRNA methyltransferase [Ponticaulis sp.]|nr:rRNA methyltransferase [Ponticaulis sp.]
MQLSFYQPDIPQNLGTAIRLSACFGVKMQIIEPCGFPLTDKALKRAMLDYGNLAQVERVDSADSFFEDAQKKSERVVLFSTQGATPLQNFEFRKTDRLMFGRESAGVPEDVHNRADARVVIPLVEGARSINVATAAAIGLFEALRQTNGLLLGAPHTLTA